MPDNPRRTKGYQAWVRQVLERCEPVCIRCGYPVDMSLPRNHPQGPSADHEPPLIETGEATPSLDGAGIAHLDCNRSHGGKLGASRATQPRSRSLETTTNTPAAPSLLSPPGPGKRQNVPSRPRYHPDGFALPRLETAQPATVRGSYGEAAEEWLRDVYGMQLRAWQRYALTRALEHDENGQLVWPTVLVTVGRQSGKSFLSRAVCMWRLHNAELFGEMQTILHVANRRSTAMEVMRPAGLWASERYGKRAVKWGNMEAGIEIPTGDRWLVHAANESAGVGYSCSFVFVDEAWKVKREVVDDALAPTMAERNQPQLWLVSTAGDSTSDLMTAYRQRALDRLGDKDPGAVLLLEWSAPQDADPDDVETWRYASPEWSDRREAFLRQQWQNVEESAWRREYLNQWVIRSDHWLRDSWWKETHDPVDLPENAQWNVAAEADFDGMGHAVAIAAVDGDKVVIRVTTHRTIREVSDRITEIRKQHPRTVVAVTPGYLDRIEAHIDQVVGQREAATATQNLLDLFDRRAIAHNGDQVLREAFAASTISRRQGGWVITAPMGGRGVYAARAVMFACAMASKTPKPVAMIRSRRRA